MHICLSLRDRPWTCAACGTEHEHDRDVDTAKNIEAGHGRSVHRLPARRRGPRDTLRARKLPRASHRSVDARRVLSRMQPAVAGRTGAFARPGRPDPPHPPARRGDRGVAHLAARGGGGMRGRRAWHHRHGFEHVAARRGCRTGRCPRALGAGCGRNRVRSARAPFDVDVPAEFAYYLASPEESADQPNVAAFREWILEEARAEGEHDDGRPVAA